MMKTPERGLKSGYETRLDTQNADEVHPAGPREQQSTEPRTIESPFESNSADAASAHVGKMGNEGQDVTRARSLVLLKKQIPGFPWKRSIRLGRFA
jgi:hypothetical protein